ncbi:MAG: HIT family protein [Anaerolineales bacterium]|jgi:histidine triad (HIT) family protein
MNMYTHAPQDYKCPFCTIGRGSHKPTARFSPSDVIYHDGKVTAFIAYRQWPINPGNTLVIPNQHYENIYSLPDEIALSVHKLARGISLAMKRAYHCDGVSLRQHNEPAGNQDVWHYHVHVTPRYQGDNFYAGYTTQWQVMEAVERAQHARLLRSHLSLLDTDH